MAKAMYLEKPKQNKYYLNTCFFVSTQYNICSQPNKCSAQPGLLDSVNQTTSGRMPLACPCRVSARLSSVVNQTALIDLVCANSYSPCYKVTYLF